jgi:hypothetical protein
MAEEGRKTRPEVEAAIRAGSAQYLLSAPSRCRPARSLEFEVSRDYPLVTL